MKDKSFLLSPSLSFSDIGDHQRTRPLLLLWNLAGRRTISLWLSKFLRIYGLPGHFQDIDYYTLSLSALYTAKAHRQSCISWVLVLVLCDRLSFVHQSSGKTSGQDFYTFLILRALYTAEAHRQTYVYTSFSFVHSRGPQATVSSSALVWSLVLVFWENLGLRFLCLSVSFKGRLVRFRLADWIL